MPIFSSSLLALRIPIIKFYKTVLLFLLFLYLPTAAGQIDKSGLKDYGEPFIKYYSPKEYNSVYQNWCVVQDSRGIMYFGNDRGILEYDGSTWRLIKTPNNSIVRKLSMDESGIIYAAASSDFGYLASDSVGYMHFVSLLKFLENRYHGFGDVWDVVAVKNTVYFKTQNKIFRWKENKIKVFESVKSYRLYKINDDVYVRNNGIGLMKISGDSLKLVPDGEKFASTGIYNMLMFNTKILITTNREGLFLYDGEKFSAFKTEADVFLKNNHIYNACTLYNNKYAFATQRGGIAVIDSAGRLIQIINTQKGLHTNIVFDVCQDKQGGLWAAMGDGISRIEILSPFTIIPENKTANDFIQSFLRFKNNLYAANSFGLLCLDRAASEFKPMPDVNSNGNNFVSIGNTLYATTNNEIVKINNGKVSNKIFDYPSPYIFKSAIDTNIIYLISRIGLAILRDNRGQLKLIKNIAGLNSELINLVEDKDGSLWIVTYYEGIVHVWSKSGNLFSAPDSVKINIDQYKRNTGVQGTRFNIFTFNGNTFFATNKGLFTFNKESKKFIPDSTFGNSFACSKNTILFSSRDVHGNLWILANTKDGNEIGKAITQTNGEILWETSPAFRRLNLNNVFAIYADYDPAAKKDLLWISTDEGFVRYNPEIINDYTGEFPTLIRRVMAGQDSLIFGGNVYDSLKKQNILSHGDNNIIIHYAALSYDNPAANLYQYYLEGNEKNWSEWSSEPSKEYTNLLTGDYKFHVRSKNIYGKIGKEDSFTFNVLSPWYSSWWVYSFYGIIFLGFLYLIRYFELQRLSKKHALELNLLAFEKLKELDRLKSEFFANISHEFRTPLTLILGQIESVLSSSVETKEKGKLIVADRNAKRLLILINQLLDLSKLEAGSMELIADRHNIVSFVKSLFYSFESLAESKKITLKFDSEIENIPVVFDPDKMEKVLCNLISNAFKFTPAGGEILIVINVINNSSVEVCVKNTGRGISKDQIGHVFDRFYQVDGSSTREFEGTGIGLALAKELIALHKGSLTASSEEDEGTEFMIHLPLENMSYKKENFVEISADKFSFTEIDDDHSAIETYKLPGKQDPDSGNLEIILIVEDNSDVRSYIREQTLKRLPGYRSVRRGRWNYKSAGDYARSYNNGCYDAKDGRLHVQ